MTGLSFATICRGRTALLGAVSALVGLSGCHGGGAAKSVTAAKTAAATPVQVDVTPAHIGSVQQVALVTGTLTAQDDVVVGVKLAGKVVAVYQREGDPVRAGQIVAQQDPGDLQAQLDQQQANLRVAQTKLDQSRVAYNNAITTLALTKAQTVSAVRQAQAALSQSQEQAKIIKQGARTQERQQSQANVDVARADRDQTRADLKRYRELYRENAISAQQLDQAQAAADSADARYNSAEQALSLIQEGNRPEDIRSSQFAVDAANQAVVTAMANRSQVTLRQADVNTAQQNILASQASVDQAAAAVRLAQKALADATVRSPIDGVVQERRAEPGQQLGAGKDVMRIVSLKNIYFDAQLPEVQFAQVQIGQAVDVNIDGQPGRLFHGVVYRLFPVASSEARSFTVRIKLMDGGNLVRPSMFARGQIVLAVHPRAVLVPREAVLDATDTNGRVFVVKNGTAHESKVTLGFADANSIEIRSGVQPGDKVVTTGQAQLQDSTQVQVLTPGTSGT